MQGNSSIFSNNYKVLEIMYDSQITINDLTYTPMTQDDIATALSCDRMTINTIFKKLKEENLIEKTPTKRQYRLTKEALRIVKAIKRI